MTLNSTIELKDLVLKTDIGTYCPGDHIPDHHLLDLTLSIAATKVLIANDGMEHVFDYEPLIAQIQTLASTGHRETQEWLVTQIVNLCANFSDIQAVAIFFRKYPVDALGGTLGIRLTIDQVDFAKLS